MNELIKLVVARTGISEAMAKMAIEVILGFFKDKLPKPLADQLFAMLGLGSSSSTDKAGRGSAADGKSDDGIGVDDVLKGLGGMFGSK